MSSGVSSREGLDQIYKGQDQKAARGLCVMLIVAALLALLYFGAPPISVDRSKGTVCTFEIISIFCIFQSLYGVFGFLMNPKRFRHLRAWLRLITVISTVLLVINAVCAFIEPLTGPAILHFSFSLTWS